MIMMIMNYVHMTVTCTLLYNDYIQHRTRIKNISKILTIKVYMYNTHEYKITE